MRIETIERLVSAADVHDYVLGLWSDGPIKQSHQQGGAVHQLVDRFARLPRFFFQASDRDAEWTHFSTWWGGILLCDYDRPAIRDLRYLHEIHHAASLAFIPNGNVATFEAKSFRNEREASTFTEMAIYLELADLRPLTFDHPLFVDRFLFPTGDLNHPDETLLARWADEPDIVFQELMYERARVIWARPEEIDADDPQIVWLRRYGEQGANWIRIWSERFQLVEDAMIRLRDESRRGNRAGALDRHLDFLLSPPIAEGTSIPFVREARSFRNDFDALIRIYEGAMDKADQKAVRGTAES